MSSRYSLMGSSVAKKYWMALTGIFLITFLLVHLSINLLTLCSDPEYFNVASEFMATNWVIKVMQYVLALGFILHIFTGIVLTSKNNAARPVKYQMNKPGANSPFSSRSMAVTGIIILLFLLLHLKDYFWQMKFGEMGDLSDYDLVVGLFSIWYYTAFYVVAFILLGIHLNHGFQSAFQSMGWRHPKYTPIVKFLGQLFCIVVPGGFAFIALYHMASSM